MGDHFAVGQRRLVVGLTAVTYLLAGVLTWSYPPEYLAFSWVWATVFTVAGLTAASTLFVKKMWLSVGSGALLVSSALFRSGAIYVELGWDRLVRAFLGQADRPQSASFAIAGTTWMLIGVLLWVGWPQVQAHLIGDSDGVN